MEGFGVGDSKDKEQLQNMRASRVCATGSIKVLV